MFRSHCLFFAYSKKAISMNYYQSLKTPILQPLYKSDLRLSNLAIRLLIMDLAKFQVRHGEIMCSVCHYAADSQSALEAHIRKHQEDPTRPYFCHSCDARFSTRKRWDQHLPKHQTETPFVCQVSYGFKPWPKASLHTL